MKIKSKSNKYIWLVVLLLLAVVIAGVTLFSYFSHKSESSNTKPTTQRLGGGSISSPRSKSDDPAPTPSSSATPLKPSGTFVSNHRPNLSGSPAPNTLTSTCTTTPGAQCMIEFTNGDVVKSLPAKTADANGNANWDWKLQDIGITEGVWKIVAIASIGTNSVKESDALDLTVGL